MKASRDSSSLTAATTSSPGLPPDETPKLTLRRFIFQIVLNLPEPKPKTLVPRSTVPDPAAPSVPDNPWLAAARGGASTVTDPQAPVDESQPGPAPTVTTVPWEVESGRTAARTWRYGLRTGVLIVIGLFAWIGIRTTLLPQDVPDQAALPAAVMFDDASAHATAARFVAAALAWNEDDPDQRTAAVALDYAGLDPTLGWNGKGRQDVNQVIPGSVLIDDDTPDEALVTVFAQTTSYTRTDRDAPWQSGSPEWMTLEVPVATISGRMVVTAGPALTGFTSPGTPDKKTVTREDPPLTGETKETADAFFAAYSQGDVTALEVPGAEIPAPQTGWPLLEVASWAVYEGSGETRAARAVVIWSPDGETTVTHTYDLTLTRVTVADAERWQVSDIHASR